jgi:hypothetical protein
VNATIEKEKPMKSVCAIVTVCCLAAAAPAGLQFMVDNQVVQNGDWVLSYPPSIFSLVNDKEGHGVFDGGAVALDKYSEFGKVTINPGMLPGRWSIIDISADFGRPAMYISWDVPSIDPLKAGKLVDFEIIWKRSVTTVEFYNVNLDPAFSVTLFTPEPATLALLGLGAIMIRRKHSA